METIEVQLKKNPPQKIDLTRKVRVYQGHFQFVELSLSGCRLKGKTITIPKYLFNLTDEKIRDSLKTTCKMMAGNGSFSKKAWIIEEKVRQLRKEYLRSLGERYGSVILRSQRTEFTKKVEEITIELENLRKVVEQELEIEIRESRQNLVEMLLPGVLKSPPPFLNNLFGVNETEVRKYLDFEIEMQMPSAL